MPKVLPWVLGLLVVLAAGYAGRRSTAAMVDSLRSRTDAYAAEEPAHRALQDSLDRARAVADSMGRLLRLGTKPAREAADHRRTVGTAEAQLAIVAPTPTVAATHWRAAYLATREEADSLRRVVADLDAAAIQDSIAKANAVQALAQLRARLDTANALIIDLRGAVEELAPSWMDRASITVGVTPRGDPAIVAGVPLTVRDVVRRLPRWMRP